MTDSDIPEEVLLAVRNVGLGDVPKEKKLYGAATRNGGRVLTGDRDPWTHNAWDNVEWDEELEQAAQESITFQELHPVPDDLRDRFNATPAKYWDEFYKNVRDTFFKDRSWLALEFPELDHAMKEDAGPMRVVEVGCGPGNTVYPLLAGSRNPDLFVHALDFSPKAVQMVQENTNYDPSKCHAEVWDLSSPEGLPEGLRDKEGKVDVVVMIFVMSALHPGEWRRARKNAWKLLKPGGTLLFRDYGRHDLAQLRFKGSRWMAPNFYVRGDNTRVYFFEKQELEELFANPFEQLPPDNMSGSPSTQPESKSHDTLSITHSPDVSRPQGTSGEIQGDNYRFETVQIGVDKRLLLNRLRKLKMYRVWLQARFRKLA